MTTLEEKIKQKELEQRALKLGLCPVCGEKIIPIAVPEIVNISETRGYLWWKKEVTVPKTIYQWFEVCTASKEHYNEHCDPDFDSDGDCDAW